MKKILVFFLLVLSLVSLTACYAKKEEVEESIRTTEALFRKLPFKPVKITFDGSYHYEGGGGTVNLYFSDQDIEKYPVLKYHPDREGNKIEFYEIFYGERTADMLLDCLTDNQTRQKLEAAVLDRQQELSEAFQVNVSSESISLRSLTFEFSEQVDTSEELRDYLELYTFFLSKDYSPNKLTEYILRHQNQRFFKWKFYFETDLAIDSATIKGTSLGEREDYMNRRYEDFVAPESMQEYLDLKELPETASVQLSFINQTGEKNIVLLNKKDTSR